MAYEIDSNLRQSRQHIARPAISSYDSGYEYSVEHCVDIKLLVQDAENEVSKPATYALGS
jgi:hypothetical protein